MPVTVHQQNLNGGEISRRLWNNTSRQRRASCVAKLENWFPGQFGGVTRRPGMEHLDTFGTGPVQMAPFKFSETTKFELAFGDEVLRIYGNGAVVEDPTSPGDPLEIETPWSADEVGLLRWHQALDTVWLTHPDYMPRVLFRRGDQDWVLSEFAPSYPPLMPQNTTSTTLTPSATSGSITLTASSATFDASHVGSYWKLGHNRTLNSISADISEVGTSSTLLVEGDYTVTTVGNWVGTVAVEQSLDGGNSWSTVKDWTAANDIIVGWVGTADFPTLLRVSVKEFTSGTAARIILNADSSTVNGLVRITSVTTPTEATALVVESLQGTTATDKWTEGAWSDYQGYPRVVSLIDGRLTFSSTYGLPLAYWSSEVDDFPDFRRSASNPAASQFRQFYSKTQNHIAWIEQRGGGVIFGAGGEEWQITGFGTSAEDVKCVSYYGSANVPAVTLHDSLIFVQEGGQVMRDYVGLTNQMDLARGQNVAIDLSGDSEHITFNGVGELCVVKSPIGIVYGLSNGNLFSLTYDRSAGVMGFARHPTDGYIHSMCSTPGDYGDEVTFAVTRNGTTRIERFHPATESLAYAGKFEQCLFADAGRVLNFTTSTQVITGLEHLEGCTIDVCRDGWPQTQAYTVENGQITLDAPATWVSYGLQFVSEIDTLPIAFQTQTGETRYKLGRINGVIVEVHNTIGLEYADADAEEWYELQRSDDNESLDTPPSLQSEPIAAPLDGKHSRQARVKLRMKKPMPASILGVAVEFSSTER